MEVTVDDLFGVIGKLYVETLVLKQMGASAPIPTTPVVVEEHATEFQGTASQSEGETWGS